MVPIVTLQLENIVFGTLFRTLFVFVTALFEVNGICSGTSKLFSLLVWGLSVFGISHKPLSKSISHSLHQTDLQREQFIWTCFPCLRQLLVVLVVRVMLIFGLMVTFSMVYCLWKAVQFHYNFLVTDWKRTLPISIFCFFSVCWYTVRDCTLLWPVTDMISEFENCCRVSIVIPVTRMLWLW